jgi:preprotein translocase subunit Sec61beta
VAGSVSREQRLFDWEGSNPPSSAGLLRRPYRTDVAGEALIDGLAVVTVVFLVASLVAGALLSLVGAAGQGANWLAGGGLLSGMAFGGRLSAAAGRPPFVERLDVSAMPGLQKKEKLCRKRK